MISRRNVLGGILGACASPLSLRASTAPKGVIEVGSRRQLLFDDFLLSMGSPQTEDIPSGIRWVLGKAVKSSAKTLLVPDQPWESMTYWVCVLRDGGKYRLWYNASLNDTRLYIAYAESDDGLTWRKPLLNLVNWRGSKANNIVFAAEPGGAELGSVFIDPIAKPAERYKMFYPTWDTAAAHPDALNAFIPESGVLRGAHSPDGLHWTQYPHIFLGKYTDTQNVAVYDPTLRRYVAYIRWTSQYGGADLGGQSILPIRRGRAVARMESEDYLRWTYPQLSLAPDFHDGLNVEIYNSAYARYPDADFAHFQFPSFYHKREGYFQVQVAVSRDNRTWTRPVRETFIAPGAPGSFDDFIVSVGPGFVPAGQDQLALYYRGGNDPHPGMIASVKPNVAKPTNGMGRVVFGRDRIIGIEAGREQGCFATRPIVFQGRRLTLNAQPTGPDAGIQVQLLSSEGLAPQNDKVLDGFRFADSNTIDSDQIDGAISWRSGASLGNWAGRPVRVQFRLRSMRLYAFQFS